MPVNPETANQEPFPSNPPAEELVTQAEHRQRLYGNLEREFDPANPPSTRTPAELDILMEEVLASGGAYKPEGDDGLPDENFPGGRIVAAEAPPVVPGAPAAPDWALIITRIRDAKERMITTDPTLATRFNTTIPPAATERPIEYLQQRARELEEAGYLKPETGRGAQPDGLFGGNRLEPTVTGLHVRATDFRTETEAAIRAHADALINARLIPPAGALTGTAAGRALGEGIRDAMSRGFLDIAERGKPAKGVPVDFDIVTVDDRRVSGISDIFQKQFDAAREAFALATPPDADAITALENYMRGLATKRELPRLRAEGATSRNELLSGANAQQARDARRRIEQLNEIDERNRTEASYAPNIEATQRRERADQIGTARASGLGAGSEGRATDAAWDAAFAEDSAARENIRVQNEYRPRIEALQAQIDATVDRNMRGGLETAMQQLVAEQGTAAAAAGAAQVEQANRDAEWMARDPAGFAREQSRRADVEPRRAAFARWAENPTMLTSYGRTRVWPDQGNGPWAGLSQIEREAAMPLLDQAYQVLNPPRQPGAPIGPVAPDMARINELRNQAFEATERVRAEQAVKEDRIHQSNDAAELKVVDAARRNQATEPIVTNLGRSDVSPELNNEIVNDARRRFNMSETPTAVRARVGQNSEGQRVDVRDLIYRSPNLPNVALVARYDRAGRMLSADLIAVQDGAFRGRRGDRPSARLSDILDDTNNRGGAQATITSFDTADQVTGSGGSGDNSDWSGYESPNIRRARRQDLTRTGMTAGSAEVVARRGPAVRRPNRGTGFFGLFGR